MSSASLLWPPCHQRTKYLYLYRSSKMMKVSANPVGSVSSTMLSSSLTTSNGEEKDSSVPKRRSRTPSIVKFYPGSHLLEELAEDGPMERDERDGSFPKILRRKSMLYPTYHYLSLWLLPPPEVRETLQHQVEKLSVEYNGSFKFMPHVTVIGCIPCTSRKQGFEIGRKLQEDLKGSGGVPCSFQKEILSMYNPDNTLVWSQASLSIMERSDTFMDLLALCRKSLGMDFEAEWMFPAPAKKPHMSHYYGNEKPPPPSSITPPPDFTAQEVALWITCPGTVKGVKEWRPLFRIDLL
jgi:hypothetical protein